MKRALVYLLLFATLLPSISPWGTIAYYHINRDYIARVLCQNRNRPELHCDGQCYLAKKLTAQQDKQDKETTEQVQTLPSFQWFCSENPSFVFGVARLVRPELVAVGYKVASYAAPLGSLFRPPRS